MVRALNIGKIVNTHGLKGEVKVYPYTNELERFEDLDHVYFDAEFKVKKNIESVRYFKNMIILKLEGFDRIEQVEKLMETPLYIDRETQGVDLEDEEYYVVDLIGLNVIDDKYGEIGVLVDVLQNTAQDLYQVKTRKGELVLIPAVKAFIGDIDFEKRIIHTHLIEGLLP